jgi:hypothetical protein
VKNERVLLHERSETQTPITTFPHILSSSQHMLTPLKASPLLSSHMESLFSSSYPFFPPFSSLFFHFLSLQHILIPLEASPFLFSQMKSLLSSAQNLSSPTEDYKPSLKRQIKNKVIPFLCSLVLYSYPFCFQPRTRAGVLDRCLLRRNFGHQQSCYRASRKCLLPTPCCVVFNLCNLPDPPNRRILKRMRPSRSSRISRWMRTWSGNHKKHCPTSVVIKEKVRASNEIV